MTNSALAGARTVTQMAPQEGQSWAPMGDKGAALASAFGQKQTFARAPHQSHSRSRIYYSKLLLLTWYKISGRPGPPGYLQQNGRVLIAPLRVIFRGHTNSGWPPIDL